jgi:hypothetical protein
MQNRSGRIKKTEGDDIPYFIANLTTVPSNGSVFGAATYG